MQKMLFHVLAALALTLAAPAARAAVQVDIYGPGQNIVNLALAAPVKGPGSEAATGLGADLNKLVRENLNVLPFMRLTDPRAVLGGVSTAGRQPPALDFKRFQLAGSDIVVTAYWPDGDGSGAAVQMRAFETNSGKRLFGKEYAPVGADVLTEVADRFCADLLQELVGSGDFFRSTLAIVKKKGKLKTDVWLVKPTGRDLRQITKMDGEAMSPAWSPDGRFVVFTHIDQRSHALGVWDRLSNKVQRIRFPGNTVIGPSFMPDNRVAVSLTNGKNPDIFLLNHAFQRERPLEESPSINVSPSFDATGSKMVFTSSRLGGPQIFLKDLTSGMVSRVSKNGAYNTEGCISPDAAVVVYSRLTDYGNRIFVQDMVTGLERQITFGPGDDEQPSFCGDSYFIAFTSNRSGSNKIYLITRHGGDAKLLPTGGGESSFPRWGKPSGR